jgi:hypothetical protein
MSILKTMQFSNSIDEIQNLENAYIRVDSLNGGKTYLGAVVGIYKSPESKSPVKIVGYWFEPKLDGKNFIAQAYDHLKTLPEFAGATDC